MEEEETPAPGSAAAPPPAESARAARERALRRLGISGLAALALAATPLAAPGPVMVPASAGGEPAWLLGPYGEGFGIGPGLYYGLLWLAFGLYLCIAYAAPCLDRRLIGAAGALLIGAFALAPPLHSADVFSYIAHARLGVLHGLNPYTSAPVEVPTDPALPHVGWAESASAYGPLFTLLTYPLAWLSVPAALWALKGVTALAVFALAALVARMAPARGVDPGRAFVLVALNPLVLAQVVGGAHNDALVMLAAVAGCAAVLGLRPASGGLAMASAVGLKLSAAFVAPFAALGAVRRSRLLWGAIAAVALLTAAALAAFGPHVLDSLTLVGENQGRVSNYSIPNLLSELTGGEIETVRAAAIAAYLLALAYLLSRVWRGGDWIAAAGWAALGLLLASAWLLPWYLIWALPFAALSRDTRLITAVLALTALQLAARVPL